MRPIPITLATLALGATLAFAEPQVRVQSIDGIVQLELREGYPSSWYTVWRATSATAPWVPLSSTSSLCMGPCFAADPSALAGGTYFYRFDFMRIDGSRVSLGPFAVTIPATLARTVGARVVPNPVRGSAEIEVHLAGTSEAAPARAEVSLLDLQGRRVRTLYDGLLPRGISRLRWDGLDAAGRPAAPGTWFVVVRSPLGEARTRLVRVR